MMKVADLEKLLLQKDKDLQVIRVRLARMLLGLTAVMGELGHRKQDVSLPCGVIVWRSLSPPGDRFRRHTSRPTPRSTP